MPQVPRLSVPGAQPEPAPNARVYPSQPALGPDFSQPLGALQGVLEQEKQKADQVVVNDADNQATQLRDRVLYGEPGQPQSGLLGKRGQQAFGGAEDAINQWNAGLEQIRTGLTDRQKLAFQNRIIGYDHDLHLEIQSHVLKERQQYDADTTKQTVDAQTNLAIQKAPTDPTASEMAIQKAGAAVRDQQRRLGQSDDAVQQAGADAVSNARLEVLRQYHALGNDQSETAYLEQHRGDFVGRDLVEAELLAREGSTAGKSVRLMRGIVSANYAPGMVTPGNIDLVHRPRVVNQDGSVSTVRSISIEEDGKTILIPTVSPAGKVLSNDDAIALYHKTGQQLGVFNRGQDADAYAQRLHALQARGLATGDFEPTLSEAIGQLDTELDQGRIDARVYEASERQIRQHYADKESDELQRRKESYQWFDGQLEQTKNLDALKRQNFRGWLDLNDMEHRRLETREDELRHPKVRTDDSVFSYLTNLGSLNDSTREQFKSLDLVKQYGGKLGEADMHHFLTWQASMRIQDDNRDERTDQSQKRRDETETLKAATSAQRQLQQRQNLDSSVTKYLPPVPRVHVPQWMVDSAKVDPDYRDYLERHGVNVDAATPTPAAARNPAAPAVTVPGGPIVRLTPQ